MNRITFGSTRSFLHRTLLTVAGVLAVAAVALTAAPKASADVPQYCHSDQSSNACLYWTYLGYGWRDANVGLDVQLPEQYAREIIACGADFRAEIRGDDGKGVNNPILRRMSLKPGWPIADANGLSVEFFQHGLKDELDEDDGEDEVYASISYYDCHTRQRVPFTTGVEKGEFRT
jgi:hypothetical protein